jgi:hypothetical protein
MNQTNNAHIDEDGTREEQELPTKGTVLSLHITPAAHVPMTSLSSAHLVPGRGIVGDRFYLRRGRDATYDRFTCDITLVEEKTIETMKRQGPPVGLGESARRNAFHDPVKHAFLDIEARTGAAALSVIEQREHVPEVHEPDSYGNAYNGHPTDHEQREQPNERRKQQGVAFFPAPCRDEHGSSTFRH